MSAPANSISFEVTDGPYEGRYDIDPGDLTCSELNAFRQAVGVTLEVALSSAGIDGDALAGLVWLLRRRGATKGLPYQAVADNITRGAIKPLAESAPEGDPVSDPTNSGDG